MTGSALHWRDRRRLWSLQEDGAPPWMGSHLQNPCPVVLDDRVRIFVNSRPRRPGIGTVSLPGWVDVDRADPRRVLGLSPAPVLELGARGCFDEFGCMCSSVVRVGDELWMYYVGWSRPVSVPYAWAIGLAVSTDGGHRFVRRFPGPVIGASHAEPYLQNGCQMIVLDDGSWWAGYSTGRDWIDDGGKLESRYTLTSARSVDGVHWQRTGAPLVPEAFAGETQTTPALFPHAGGWGMLFSSRHSVGFRNAARGYRLGFAWSADLETWERDDARGGLAPSAAGWDAEMVCYPHVFDLDGEQWLVYAGNGFGADAIGLARLSAGEGVA